jgi:hypothetical protein
MTDPKSAACGTLETYFAPIHSDARMRDVATVQQQLAAGIDVNLVNGRATNGDGGNTALGFAAHGPWPNGADIARVLIAAGPTSTNRANTGEPRCTWPQRGDTRMLQNSSWKTEPIRPSPTTRA